jgi:hypothetical protein
MTTTIPQQQTDDVRIVRTPPTVADAQLIVQMQTSNALTGADRGYGVLRRFDNPPTLAQLRKKCPPDSDDYRYVMQFLGSCETTGTFVKHGLLNEALINDLYAIAPVWGLSEKICKGIRRETGEPRMYENFEWLAGRAV